MLPHLHINMQFFVQLTSQGLRLCFPRFNLSTGKLPKAAGRTIGRATAGKNAAPVNDDGPDDEQWLRHVPTLRHHITPEPA